VASHFLGDRVKVKSITIEDSIILVHMTSHGPDDPLCCPTMDVTRAYVLDGEQLIRFADQSSPFDSE
jgi:hypothetical protein